MGSRVVVGGLLTFLAGLGSAFAHGMWQVVHGVAVAVSLLLFALWVHHGGPIRR